MTAHGSMVLLREAQVPWLLSQSGIKMYHVWRHCVYHPSRAWWRLNYDNCSTNRACGTAIIVEEACNLAWNIYLRKIVIVLEKHFIATFEFFSDSNIFEEVFSFVLWSLKCGQRNKNNLFFYSFCFVLFIFLNICGTI